MPAVSANSQSLLEDPQPLRLRDLAAPAASMLKALVVQAGGFGAVLTAMKAHPASADVQAQGCATLASLAALEANKALVARAVGIEAGLAAMQAHPESVRVLALGRDAQCACATNLSN